MHGLFWSVIRAAAWLPLAALAATATAANHSCGLIANGEVRCWGRNAERQPGMNVSGIVTVADSGLLRARLNGLPGPSGLRPLCVSAATCSGSGP